jgi:RHS repeat-associated protein
VKKITKLNNTVLEYLYDALGHRVQKRSLAGTAQQNRNWTIRDAQGNALATYEQDGLNDPIQLKELPIYGSSRTGMHIGGTNPDTMSYGIFTRRLNQRNFEIQDHLGNVRAVVSDLKNPDNSAQVLNLNDYYPFGMISRKEESVAYRYGYNTQEKSDDISGADNHYTALYWEYSPRIARRWNIDPKPVDGVSPYSTFLNNPILNSDVMGDSVEVKNTEETNEGQYISSKSFSRNHLEKTLNGFIGNFADKDNRSYAPKIADYLKSNSVDVYLVSDSYINGLASTVNNEKFSTIYISQRAYTKESKKLLAAYFHEAVHAENVNNREFQARAATFAAGFDSREDVLNTFQNSSPEKSNYNGKSLRWQDYVRENMPKEFNKYFKYGFDSNGQPKITITNEKKFLRDFYNYGCKIIGTK